MRGSIDALSNHAWTNAWGRAMANTPDKTCLPLLVDIRARVTTQAELILSQYPTE
ncbi:hypothetical protein [Xenorhabdus sp. GDc328]|uniref:hypothetical protein n=1 Tax=Xenorhabdus sp. GDc328 TaxID=742178 RepID=UPI000A569996|nr:hypothetical protein [Xenorhabdus sp. GDc328]